MRLENPMQGQVWKLLLVNTLSCGVEACMAVGTVYIAPLLLQAGMEERYMTMVFAVGPVLGLIFIPMIGSASDSWQGRFGRRRPFIWLLSLGILLSLQLIPQAWRLAVLMCPQHPRMLEAALQVAAVCLMEFCGQACLTLLVTLLSDLFPREEENRTAFTVNSLVTSLGGCLGFLLPAMDWSQASVSTSLGGQKSFVYLLLTFILLGCLLTTAFITEETGTRAAEKKSVSCSPLKSWSSRCCLRLFLPKPQCFLIALGRCVSACTSVVPCVYAACVRVPEVIRRLFLAEVFSWMAVMNVMLFFADFMGEGLYQGLPSAEPQSEERRRYDEGVQMASLGLFLQCAVSVLCSVLMDFWVALLGVRVVYISSEALLVFATTVMTVSDSVITVTVMTAITGYTLCVLQVLPYNLLCLYHSNIQTFFTSKPRPPLLSKRNDEALTKPHHSLDPAAPHAKCHMGGLPLLGAELSVALPHGSLSVAGGDRGEADCAPASQRGLCLDMAILESAYLLSQVLPALCLGFLVQLADSVRVYMASACCFSLLAFFCSTRIVYSHADLQH